MRLLCFYIDIFISILYVFIYDFSYFAVEIVLKLHSRYDCSIQFIKSIFIYNHNKNSIYSLLC